MRLGVRVVLGLLCVVLQRDQVVEMLLQLRHLPVQKSLHLILLRIVFLFQLTENFKAHGPPIWVRRVHSVGGWVIWIRVLQALQNVMIWQVGVSMRCQLCRRSAEMHQDKRGKRGGLGGRGEQNATAMTVKIVMVKRGKKFLLRGLKVWSIAHKESHMRQSPAVLEEQASQEQTECLAPCCSPQSNNLEGPVP